MKRFIFEARNGLYIIDLAKTLQQIRNAVEVVKRHRRKTQIYSLCRHKKTSESRRPRTGRSVRRILRVRTLAGRHVNKHDDNPSIDQKTGTN